MNGCVYEKDGKCMKYTTDIVTSYCYGNGYPCKDRAITNGMKIRAMTDEELAVWISALYTTQYHAGADPHIWLEWLKQEATE